MYSCPCSLSSRRIWRITEQLFEFECSVPLFHHESTTTTTTCLLTCLCCSSVIIDCGCDVRLGHSIAMDVHSSLNLCLAPLPSTPKSTNKLGGNVKDDAGKNRVTLTQRLPQRQRLHVQSVQLPLMAIHNAGGRGNLHRYFLGRTVVSSPFVPVYRSLPAKQTSLGRFFTSGKVRSTPFVRSQCQKPSVQTKLSSLFKMRDAWLYSPASQSSDKRLFRLARTNKHAALGYGVCLGGFVSLSGQAAGLCV